MVGLEELGVSGKSTGAAFDNDGGSVSGSADRKREKREK